MKKFIAKIFLPAMLVGLLSVPVFAADVNVTVDGKTVEFADAKPFISQEGRTMLPLRTVGDALGCEIGWDANYKIVRVLGPVYTTEYASEANGNMNEYMESMMYLQPNSTGLSWEFLAKYAQGTESFTDLLPREGGGGGFFYEMDTAPVIENGRTYLPIRAIAELCGYNVDWNSEAQTVVITSTDKFGSCYLEKASDDKEDEYYNAFFPNGQYADEANMNFK